MVKIAIYGLLFFPRNQSPITNHLSLATASNSLYFRKRNSTKAEVRLPFDLEKLTLIGWEVKRRESNSSGTTKVNFNHKSPDGMTLKSAKDVEKYLREAKAFSQVAVESRSKHNFTFMYF